MQTIAAARIAANNLRARADAAFADAEQNGGATRWAIAASLESRANRAEDFVVDAERAGEGGDAEYSANQAISLANV
jgi:hypothetical protein